MINFSKFLICKIDLLKTNGKDLKTVAVKNGYNDEKEKKSGNEISEECVHFYCWLEDKC